MLRRLPLPTGRPARSLSAGACLAAALLLPAGAAATAPTDTYLPLTYAHGSNAGKQRDLSWGVTADAATAQVGSIATGGLGPTRFTAAEPSKGRVFLVSNTVARFAPGSPANGSGSGRTLGLQVDGVNTWLAGSWNDAGGDAVPFASYADVPVVGVDRSTAAGGALVLDEHHALRQCVGTDTTQYPLGGFTCQDSLRDPGVRIDVRTTVQPAGDVVWRDWSITATDGKPHAVALTLSDYVASADSSFQRAFGIAGGAYARRDEGEAITAQLPATGAFSIRARRESGADTDAIDGFAGITFGQRPLSAKFTGVRQLTTTYALALPAAGSRQLHFSYATEPTLDALDDATRAAEQRLGGGEVLPTSTPAPTPTPEPVRALATVVPGAVRTPVADGPAARATPPTLVRTGKPRLVGRRLTLGYAVRCAGAGSSCRATLALTPPRKRGSRRAPVPYGKATLTVPAGQTAAVVVTVRLSKAALRRARPTITGRLVRGSAAPVPVSQPWRI